jgi:hypothetical protein
MFIRNLLDISTISLYNTKDYIITTPVFGKRENSERRKIAKILFLYFGFFLLFSGKN